MTTADLTAATTAQRERIAVALLAMQRSARLMIAMTSQAAYAVRHNAPDAAEIVERTVDEWRRMGEEIERLRAD